MQIFILILTMVSFLVGFPLFAIGLIKTPSYSSRESGIVLSLAGLIIMTLGIFLLASYSKM